MLQNMRLVKNFYHNIYWFKKNNSLMKLGNLNIWVDSLNYNYVEITHNQFLLMLVDLVRLNYKIEL